MLIKVGSLSRGDYCEDETVFFAYGDQDGIFLSRPQAIALREMLSFAISRTIAGDYPVDAVIEIND